MNRQEWEAQVFASDMNPTARMICLAVGSHGNWEKTQNVWPSRQRISSMTGASRETVGKYMTALEEQGWLKLVKIRKDNVREYELSTPQVVVSYGILAVKNRGTNLNQVVVDDEEVVVNYDKQVVVDDGLGCLELRQEPTKNLPEEPINEPTSTTGASAGMQLGEGKEVVDTSPNPPDASYGSEASAGATATSPNGTEGLSTSANAPVDVAKATFSDREMFEAYIGWTKPIKDDEPFKAKLKELAMDRTFEPQENRPNHRLQLAAQQINQERGALL